MADKKDIDFKTIEKKWQERWEKDRAFEVQEDSEKEKFYVLEMYPYPSGSGLHMGHAFNYSIGDIYARFKRMKGFNVLYPMGYDSFGLPAENAAKKNKSHPKKFTEEAIGNFIKQQKSLGLSYDWTRKIASHDPNYYRWNQFWFLRFLEKGLVYRKKAPVNWCNKCGTVLANEQVHNGKCWRHTDEEVEIKQLEQWFIKTTEYADELLEKVGELEWPERIKIMQKNWIGKSHGAELEFEINGGGWKIFTTRPDTLMGVTFMVVSAQHSRLDDLVTEEQRKEVDAFLNKVKSTSDKDLGELEKEGVFTGSYAKHPITGKEVPVWAGNFVLADYGSGMVMAVPAHDQRDYEFAKKYGIEIKTVIESLEGEEKEGEAFTGYGKLVNSDAFDGLKSEEAKEHIVNALGEKGKKTVNYKLRDWLVSRQRYWGTPIPVVYCDDCGIVPVSEKDLPVLLPEDVKFDEETGNPLTENEKFLKVKCSKCGNDARRETDTMDTFFDSSWYYLRYADAQNTEEAFSKKNVGYWLPVDQYIGGAEHACMHLIYARFFTKALRDLGFLKFDEPFKKLFNQGMLHGDDGYVMSKSRGNVKLPEEVSENYGMDTARLFLVSIASPDKDLNWSDEGIEGSLRFIKKVMKFFEGVRAGKSSGRVGHKINLLVRDFSKNIENMSYNLAVISLRQTFEALFDEKEISQEDLESLVKVLSPICPHIAEELWEKIGGEGLVSLAQWPEVDEGKIDEKIEQAEQAVEKTVSDVNNILNIVKEKEGKNAKKIYIYAIPPEVANYDSEVLGKRLGVEVEVCASNKPIHDPEGKAKKAKPGKPGIYVE